MQLKFKRVGLALLATAWLVTACRADVTNTAPWSDSFETYPAGVSIAGSNGWTETIPGSIIVTNEAGLVSALASYTNTAGHTYPLPGASHTNVAEISSESANTLKSATTNGIVKVDFMAMPTWCDVAPIGKPSNHFAVHVWTNGLLSVWHADSTASPATNVWLNLTNSPVVSTTAWVRLTFLQDYTNHMFQVSVDGTALVDGKGWSYGGGVQGGSWFHMATNTTGMSRFVAEEARLDDLNSTMRSLSWSRTGFAENVINNGSIDNSTPLSITLSQDTFAGVVGEDFVAGGKLVVTGLPSNLVAVAVLNNHSNLTVTVSNSAVASQQADSVSNLVMRFTDAAFTLLRSYDVSGSVVTNGTVTFLDTPLLTYGTTTFTESLANDGTVVGTTLTLEGKQFNAVEGEELVGAHKVTVVHLPPGLGMQIVRGASALLATLTFTGKASSHAAANSISNLGITFTDLAFVGGRASDLGNDVLNNLVVQFRDPRGVAYSGTTFNELTGGAIDNRRPVVLTLSGDTFAGTVGDEFVGAGKITVDNLPSGLSALVTMSSSTQLSVQLAGTAGNNTTADSVSNVVFTLQDSAFTLLNAVSVANFQKTGIKVLFNDLTGGFNLVPFTDSFEGYVAGFQIGGSNGWSAITTITAGIVTNDATANAALSDYVRMNRHTYPVHGPHTQTLLVSDDIKNEIHSGEATNVVVDFMMIPSVVAEATPETNNQIACYVNTNLQVVVWHSNRTTQVNEWLVLANAPTLSTSAWARFTFESDYVHNMYQVRINEGDPITSPQGWAQNGVAPTGSWFYMTQTKGSMSRFKVTGAGGLFLDDLAVRESLPGDFGGGTIGGVYIFR